MFQDSTSSSEESDSSEPSESSENDEDLESSEEFGSESSDREETTDRPETSGEDCDDLGESEETFDDLNYDTEENGNDTSGEDPMLVGNGTIQENPVDAFFAKDISFWISSMGAESFEELRGILVKRLVRITI